MSGAAQPEERIESYGATGTDGPSGPSGPSGLREAVAERVAAHRNRRAERQAQEAELDADVRRRRENARHEARRGAGTVRDAVLARYQNSQSYREFLAAEAERALAQAQAEAEVAARNARAVADAQMELLEDIAEWNRSEPAVQDRSPREQALAARQAELRDDLAHALADIALGARELIAEPPRLTIVESAATAFTPAPASPPVTEISAGGLTVKLYEDLGPAKRASSMQLPASEVARLFESHEELQQLDQEIEFRRAPEFVDHILETTAIPGNLIEFPRELIAARRARPRLAEGPLREEADRAEPQLRIFEVDAAQLAAPAEVEESPAAAPEWQSLLLEAAVPSQGMPAGTQARFAHLAHLAPEPETAPVELRLMAAAVDGCAVGTAFLLFSTAAAWLAGPALRSMSLGLLTGSALATLAVLGFLYQMLFFSLANGTPGMLWARIGLCTFSDRNPTREAMRRRVYATILAACPLGLGLLWMWMDDDRLGWHDRMSRMYQRAY